MCVEPLLMLPSNYGNAEAILGGVSADENRHGGYFAARTRSIDFRGSRSPYAILRETFSLQFTERRILT